MEFNKPECLKLTGNLAENFKVFKEEVTVFFDATEMRLWNTISFSPENKILKKCLISFKRT